jgi:hypothetical protein
MQARRNDGWSDAVSQVVAAGRALLFYREHRELFGLEVIRKYCAPGDMLFHMRHRHFLSSRLSWSQRIDCALTHYRCEGQQHVGAYKDAVYRNAGLTLWSRTVDANSYALVLRATTDLRHEGGISVVLLAGDVCVSEMSYAWVNSSIFGMPENIVPFITRNQSLRCDASPLQQFRRDFPQNSPSYFCLAAVHGVAAAHGKSQIVGIKDDCQIAFDVRHAGGFRSSYNDFWHSFGGVELDGQAYLMALPLVTPSLAEVKANHRQRAIARRRHWSEITEGAATIMSRYVRDVEARLTKGQAKVLAMIAPHVSTLMSLVVAV